MAMARLSQDFRQGLRGLRKRPAFTVTTALTLALGIGLSTAVFTVAEALLLRRLPVRDEERIVVLWGKKATEEFNYPIGLDAARQFSEQSRTMEGVGSFAYEGATPVLVRDGDRLSRLHRALVSGDFFQVLGARPVLGRELRRTDDRWGTERVVVLSHETWQTRFGGDTGVIGQRVLTHEDGVAYTIVGVMPRGLDYPRGTDFWAAIHAVIPQTSLQYAAVNLIGRLAPGATGAQARNELSAFFTRPESPPWLRDLRGASNPLVNLMIGDARPAVIAFGAAAALLLLIACLNVANLLLVRGIGRAREMAIRSAIGATRADLVHQLLTENALLALSGALLGAVIASATVKAFVTFAPESVPRLNEVGLGAPTVAVALSISTVALLCFGLAPALVASRRDPQTVLRADARQSAGKRSGLMREALVATQVGLALLVLSAAGLIARSLINLERADFGFEGSRLLIAELALRYDQLDDVPKQRAAIDLASRRVQDIPQVRAVSPVVAPPFSATGWDGRPAKDGQTLQDAVRNPMLNMEVVAPAYFETMNLPVLRGRTFMDTDREGAPPVVVLSESAARYYWRGDEPLGKLLRMGPQLERSATVIGVVPDTRYRELRVARPSIYFPLRQAQFPFTATTLVIGTHGDPVDAVAALRRVVGDSTPGIALAGVAPFERFLREPLAQPRMNALLLAVFASACVILSAIGLLGVMSTMVRERTREFGVRIALGATPRVVQLMVIRRGLAIACIGLGAGLAAALLANRLLTALLYDVTPTDATTLFAVTALLLAVTVVANLVPVRSSSRISVVDALRVEG
jgi:putative ABC transport system permease protein